MTGKPIVETFFDPVTFTYSYVVSAPNTGDCAIIDAVLDYDPASGRVDTNCAQQIIDFVKTNSLKVQWILDTHVHADHLSASSYLQHRLGGKTAIGHLVTQVQQTFADVFHVESGFVADGHQFDHLLCAQSAFRVGDLDVSVLETPGHTPACLTYVIAGVAFVGDTLFMPDYGTARTDFPGGDAGTLYRSIRRILALPSETELYLCHDYGTEEREEFCHLTTVAEQRATNIHVHDGISLADFVGLRNARDQGLSAPKLLLPSVQFNMRGGDFPPAEDNGTRYFKIPLDTQACGDLSA
ncbi:MAG: MBL fold metallo-hydrolase [Pseudomonadaceae bacterium]|nr:MBL fold metallo-hydrolase [Pseudomonadaceae bacterium]